MTKKNKNSSFEMFRCITQSIFALEVLSIAIQKRLRMVLVFALRHWHSGVIYHGIVDEH